jgi:hypothetical protein
VWLVNRSRVTPLYIIAPLFAALASGCGKVDDEPFPEQMKMDPAALGTKENPARTCAELHAANGSSGVVWLRNGEGNVPPFEVYCEQELNNGGWAMVENSVLRNDGTTAEFWRLTYADRLKRIGVPGVDQNYYDGSMYVVGREYMDVFVDLNGNVAVAAVMTTSGINPGTMQFITPAQTGGNVDVFTSQFSSGWSAADFDGDTQATENCAKFYGSVAQHYRACWEYNLGVDADEPSVDGGFGPHVSNKVLTALGLSLQPNGGNYSQVKRIARFTRW